MDGLAYIKTLGLVQHPFPVAPDDSNFYTSPYLRQIIDEIVHGIVACKGFMVLSGEVGVGKTTITRRILKILERHQVRTSLVFHTSLKDVDLLREINRDFGLAVPSVTDGGRLGDYLQQLNDFLMDQYAKGIHCAIIIDDAQNLDRDSLELVRMISNLEVDRQKLVQILLVGQTELMMNLNSPVLRQMQSRMVIRKVVRSLSREELLDYIRFKLEAAGNNGSIHMTRPAFWRLYHITRGNCRYVNLLLDRCLYVLCHLSEKIITYHIIGLAHTDLKPGKFRRSMRVLSVPTALLAAVVMVSWTLHMYTGRTTLAAVSEHINLSEASQGVSAPVETAVFETLTNSPDDLDAQSEPASVSVHPAVVAFMNIYQLDRYCQGFQRGLRTGNLETLAIRIYATSGYRLVRLPEISDRIRQHYGALAFSLAEGRPPTWFLFWKPKLELKRFYNKYKGEEISRLQELLATRDFYHHECDGIVGPVTTNAVIAFQKASGLPTTGFPDEATLFLLCHQTERT